MAGSAQDMFWVIYAPYLPLRRSARVGPWELIPRSELDDSDARGPHVVRLAQGLADIHELPSGTIGQVGAFARHTAGRVGDEPQGFDEIQDLHRALVVGVLANNQSPLLPADERSLNAAHESLTSDNAMVFAPGINSAGYTGELRGGRVRMFNLGLKVIDHLEGLPPSKISPPGDLHLPTMAHDLDTFYADAVWQRITDGTDAARRLATAIDWLDVAWRNTSGMTDHVRVPAIHAGFEVLLDATTTATVAHELSRLLDQPRAPKTLRTWTNHRGQATKRNISDLHWWALQFSELRGRLMHGGALTQDDWIYNGVPHIDLGEWWLRQAIRETVARAGHPDVRLGPFERDGKQRHDEIARQLAELELADSESGDGD